MPRSSATARSDVSAVRSGRPPAHPGCCPTPSSRCLTPSSPWSTPSSRGRRRRAAAQRRRAAGYPSSDWSGRRTAGQGDRPLFRHRSLRSRAGDDHRQPGPWKSNRRAARDSDRIEGLVSMSQICNESCKAGSRKLRRRSNCASTRRSIPRASIGSLAIASASTSAISAHAAPVCEIEPMFDVFVPPLDTDASTVRRADDDTSSSVDLEGRRS